MFVHYFTEFTLLTQIKIKPLHPVSLGRFCLVFLKDTSFTLSMKYLFVIVQAFFNCVLLLMMIKQCCWTQKKKLSWVNYCLIHDIPTELEHSAEITRLSFVLFYLQNSHGIYDDANFFVFYGNIIFSKEFCIHSLST